jgi:hypothetical protein
MAPIAFAQITGENTGQLAGKVTDADNGGALIGTNVIIDGTQLGAAVDVDGNYLVKNITAGAYTVRFSLVGYAAKTVNNVVVEAGQTAKIDVILKEEVIQGEEVVVEATRS